MAPYLPIILATQVFTVAIPKGNSNNCACLQNNDVWGMSAVIAYWWRVTTGNRVVVLIGWRRGTKPTEIWDWFIFCFCYRLRWAVFHKIMRDRVISRFLKLWIPGAYDSATAYHSNVWFSHSQKCPPPPVPPYSSGSKNQPYPYKPNRDQHQFSPNNIHTLSRDKMITKEKMPRSFIKFSQLNL